MALIGDVIPIRFMGGIETKMDPKTVARTKLLVLENGVFTRAVSLIKRNGYISLPSTVLGSPLPMSGAKRMATRGKELIAFNDERAYSHISVANKWADAGAVEMPTMVDRVIAKTGTQQGLADSAALGGVRVAAWEDSAGGVWYAVLDDTSNMTIRAPAQMRADGERPRVVVCGGRLHVYCAVPTQGMIYATQIDPSEPTTATAASPLVIDLSATKPYFDAEPFNGAVILVWVADAVTFRMGYVDPSMVLGSPVTGWPSAITQAGTFDTAIAVATDPDVGSNTKRIAVVTLDSVGAQSTTYLYNSATLALTSSSAVAVVGVPTRVTAAFQRDAVASGARELWIAIEITAATRRDRSVQIWTFPVDAAPTLATTQRGCGLASRAFRQAGGVYAWVGHHVTFYSVALCVRLGSASPLQCVARALPGIWAGLATHSHLAGAWDADGDTNTHRWTATYQDVLQAVAGNQFAESGIRVVDLDWDDDASHQTVELGKSAYVGGGCLRQYDGTRWSEAGYNYAPDEMTVVKAGGGAMTPSATYEYVAWYEETLSNGEIDRGPVSAPLVVQLGPAESKVTITGPMYRLTGRRNVRVCIGRSQPGIGGVYTKVTDLNPANTVGDNRFVANDSTVDTFAFVDAMSDLTSLTKPNVYVNGGVLSNDPIPGGSTITVGKNRIFVSDPSSPFALYYTKDLQEGYAAEFNAAFRIVTDSFGGAITGLWTLDDTVIIFKEFAILFIAGDGPFANPDLGGGWSIPTLITSDMGCLNGRSISITPMGAVFQSRKGIQLLARDRSVRYLGKPVEAFNAQTYRSADLIADTTQIRFLTDSGKTLLYDYQHDQWSTFTNHEGLDAVLVDGVYHYLRKDGRVFKEVPGVYSDDGQPITMRFETAWIKPGEILQQYQRVWYALMIGERKSPHWFRAQHRINYDVAWSDPDAGEFNATGLAPSGDPWIADWETGWVNGNDIVSGEAGRLYGDGNYGDGPYGGTPLGIPVFQWKQHLGLACEAIQFRFEDRQITGQPGPSFELTELLLEVGLKSKTFKGALPDGRSA